MRTSRVSLDDMWCLYSGSTYTIKTRHYNNCIQQSVTWGEMSTSKILAFSINTTLPGEHKKSSGLYKNADFAFHVP